MANETKVEKQMDTVIFLLQHLLCLELTDRGLTQAEIGKHLHIQKSKVVDMQKGLEQVKK